MRVIEPAALKRRSIKKKKQSKRPLFFLFVVIVVASAGIWYMIRPQKIDQALTKPSPAPQKDVATETPKKRTKMRSFTNQEFVTFYTSFAYPNTSELITPPVITGNAAADVRIQQIAEKRGYKLRSVPISSPEVLAEGGYELQQKAVDPLIEMQAAAKKVGHSIQLTAAFRSVETQRQLFLERLGASPEAIAAGTADAAVNETLARTAPPGYSRHHNGFTVDFSCGAIGGEAFLSTTCYAWLSANNFANAKNYGWIPSYPEGAHVTGPEPEPWEFVWVGRESLLE